MNHWTGPHLVAKSDKKNVMVSLGRRQAFSNFNIAQLKQANHLSMSKSHRNDLITVNYTETINELDSPMKFSMKLNGKKLKYLFADIPSRSCFEKKLEITPIAFHHVLF